MFAIGLSIGIRGRLSLLVVVIGADSITAKWKLRIGRVPSAVMACTSHYMLAGSCKGPRAIRPFTGRGQYGFWRLVNGIVHSVDARMYG